MPKEHAPALAGDAKTENVSVLKDFPRVREVKACKQALSLLNEWYKK